MEKLIKEIEVKMVEIENQIDAVSDSDTEGLCYQQGQLVAYREMLMKLKAL